MPTKVERFQAQIDGERKNDYILGEIRKLLSTSYTGQLSLHIQDGRIEVFERTSVLRSRNLKLDSLEGGPLESD